MTKWKWHQVRQWAKICLFSLLSIFLFASAMEFEVWAAEKYPNRPITLLIPYPPGGASDLAGRIIAEKMEEFLGQPLVITHKPGAGGLLAAGFLAKAKPDGYTASTILNTVFLPPEVKKVPYTFDDFLFTGMFAAAPYFLAVPLNAKWKNLKEFVEDAKKNPGKFSYGTGGIYTGGHLVGILFQKYAGIKLTHVPFAGCGPVIPTVLGGHVDIYLCVGAGVIEDSTSFRILATAEKERLEGLSNIPSINEFGYPANFTSLYTIAVPKGTPEEVVDTLRNAQKKALEKYGKGIKEKLRNVQMWMDVRDPDEQLKEFKRSYEVIRMVAIETGEVLK